MARKGNKSNAKCYDSYKMSGRKDTNKKLKQARHEKRLARFAKRKEEGKCYEYSASRAETKRKEALEEGVVLGTNVDSNRGTHTHYAKLTSFFRKVDYQIEEDKKKEKAFARKGGVKTA